MIDGASDATRRTVVATRLRMAREMAGLSQGQVAKLLGLHRPSVSEIEAGRRKVSADEITRLAEIYGVSLSWLARAKGEDSEADPHDDRIELAARELAKLEPQDLKRLMGLLRAIRTEKDETG